MPKIKDQVIKAAILDMDGVLWRENTPLYDLSELFRLFDENGLSVVLATNNGTNTADQYLQKLNKFGVRLESWQVVTSSMAAAYLIEKDFPEGGPIYIMGSEALSENLKEKGFFHSTESPQAVVAGLNWEFNYEMIKHTSLKIQEGLPFFYTNPDPTYPSPEGNIPGAGMVLAALETASGKKAKIAGKPQPYLFEVAMERLNTVPEETAVIGDRLNTDILGGYNAGCKTVFVLSGVNNLKDLIKYKFKPDLIIDHIGELFSKLKT